MIPTPRLGVYIICSKRGVFSKNQVSPTREAYTQGGPVKAHLLHVYFKAKAKKFRSKAGASVGGAHKTEKQAIFGPKLDSHPTSKRGQNGLLFGLFPPFFLLALPGWGFEPVTGPFRSILKKVTHTGPFGGNASGVDLALKSGPVYRRYSPFSLIFAVIPCYSPVFRRFPPFSPLNLRRFPSFLPVLRPFFASFRRYIPVFTVFYRIPPLSHTL